MRTAHLCNGLGGSLWTGAILGWHSVYALDSDPWRCDRVRDQSNAGWWPGLHVDCADLTDWQPPTLDGGVDLLAAGFSCRDISCAGKGEGLGGKSTGPTYRGCLRAIDAWRPARVFLENSPEIRSRGLSVVLADFSDRGYRARCGVIAAADAGAPHERDRWYCLAVRADADIDGLRGLQPQGSVPDQWRWDLHGTTSPANTAALRRQVGGGLAGPGPSIATDSDGAQDAAHALRHGLEIAVQRGGLQQADREAIEAAAGYCGAHHWNPPHASVLPVVDGLATGSPGGDKGAWIAALGDAWVPLQAAAAWALLGGPIDHTDNGRG